MKLRHLSILLLSICLPIACTQTVESPVLKKVESVPTATIQEAAELLGNEDHTPAQKMNNLDIFRKKYKRVTGQGYVVSVAGVGNYFSALLCTKAKEKCGTFERERVNLAVDLHRVPKQVALSWNKGDLVEFSGTFEGCKLGTRTIQLRNLDSRKIN